jgi:hypothetical protein
VSPILGRYREAAATTSRLSYLLIFRRKMIPSLEILRRRKKDLNIFHPPCVAVGLASPTP